MNELLFSVMIVNYNGQRFLPACLGALQTQTLPRYQYEVVIIDNASSDESASLATAQFPWVRFVRFAKNLGFTGGNNAGLPYLHGRFVVLLNNDTIPDPYWLAELACVVIRGGAAASKLVFADDPGSLNSAGLQLLRDGRGFDLGFRSQDAGQFEATRSVFAACGASLVFDRAIVGDRLFDSRFFMYYEDLDAGWRWQLAGRGLAFAPRSLVRHVHGGSSGDESPLFRFHVERNRTLTSVQNGDLFLVAFAILGQIARLARAVVRLAQGQEQPARVKAQAWAFVSMLGHLPSSFVERFQRRGREAMPCAS